MNQLDVLVCKTLPQFYLALQIFMSAGCE